MWEMIYEINENGKLYEINETLTLPDSQPAFGSGYAGLGWVQHHLAFFRI